MNNPSPPIKSPSSSFRLVIFDWDGTLMDSADLIIRGVQATAHELNLPIVSSKCIRQGIGLSFADQLKNLFPKHIDRIDKTAFRHCYERHFTQLYTNNGHPPLVEGTKKVLHALKQKGFLLAVATSMPTKILSGLLSDLKMDAIFDSIRCGDQALPKPHPQMLLEILTALKLTPADALMVGDTDFDMRMAQRAKMAGVAVTYGMHSVERLRQHHPLACIDRLPDLLKIVNKHNATNSFGV